MQWLRFVWSSALKVTMENQSINGDFQFRRREVQKYPHTNDLVISPTKSTKSTNSKSIIGARNVCLFLSCFVCLQTNKWHWSRCMNFYSHLPVDRFYLFFNSLKKINNRKLLDEEERKNLQSANWTFWERRNTHSRTCNPSELSK